MDKAGTSTERYLGEGLDILDRIPMFAQRILMVGGQRGETGALIKRKCGATVIALEPDPDLAAIAHHLLDAVAHTPEDLRPFTKETPFDLLLVLGECDTPAALTTLVARTLPSLSSHSQVLFILPPPSYPNVLRCDEATQVANDAGLQGYTYWVEGNEELTSAKAPHSAARILMCFVPKDYNPREHARALDDAGHPDQAFELLKAIPESHLYSPEIIGETRAEALLYLLKWFKANPSVNMLEYFDQIQKYFYQGTCHQPTFSPLYQIQAELWQRLGDTQIASGILRSIQQVAPNESVAQQLAVFPETVQQVYGEEAPIPTLLPTQKPLRILYVTHPRFHYGLDVLYNGLCQQLGDDNVVDFPYKPSLHGDLPEAFAHYPCSFNHGGPKLELADLLARLRSGLFDLILYGDCEQGLDQTMSRAIVQAAGHTPIFLMDQIDDAINMRYRVAEYLGIDDWAAYFKREMLACCDYGPNTYPVPFAYANDRASATPNFERQPEMFWAGHRLYGARRIFLDTLESRMNLDLSEQFTPEIYMKRLQSARVGLNLYGYGFDTVRFWEIPAHGALLLSQRLPIRIPQPFKDGETALYFDDVDSLEQQLRFAFDNTEEAQTIARAGHQHFMNHHTASARAQQVLAWVQAHLETM